MGLFRLGPVYVLSELIIVVANFYPGSKSGGVCLWLGYIHSRVKRTGQVIHTSSVKARGVKQISMLISVVCGCHGERFDCGWSSWSVF